MLTILRRLLFHGNRHLLAGLPQAPAYYDPYTHTYPDDRAKKRQGVVLSLMVEAGYITKEEADKDPELK